MRLGAIVSVPGQQRDLPDTERLYIANTVMLEGLTGAWWLKY